MLGACICLDVEDGPSFSREAAVRARLVHECVECRRLIPKGALHRVDKGVWDGEWRTFRTCLLCYDIRCSLFSCGWAYGRMWDDIHETYRDSPWSDDLDETEGPDEERWLAWLDPPDWPIGADGR